MTNPHLNAMKLGQAEAFTNSTPHHSADSGSPARDSTNAIHPVGRRASRSLDVFGPGGTLRTREAAGRRPTKGSGAAES